MRKFLPLFLFVFVILAGVVSAAPSIKTVDTNNAGYQIFHPQFQYVPQYTDFKLHVHASNISDGYPLSPADGIDCFLHLYGPDGNHTFESPAMGADGNGFEWDIFIDGANFTLLGEHGYYIWCNSTEFGGEAKGTFEVTTAGYVSATDSSNFKLFIIMIIASVILFALGYILDSDWVVFLSGILWILTGMYGMIYGIGNLSNLYTRGISVITLVIGLVFVIGSAYNMFNRE